MEEEFVQNQERLRPTEEKAEEERSKVEELRSTPMGVGSLEEVFFYFLFSIFFFLHFLHDEFV